MDCTQFKDTVSHICLTGTVVASWSLTQEVAGLNPFNVMTNIFVTEFAEFNETFRKNPTYTPCFGLLVTSPLGFKATVASLSLLQKH